MGATSLTLFAACVCGCLLAGYVFWRHFWFYRNPPRTPPSQAGIVSPADGTVVYVRSVAPREDVVVIKEGVRATVADILHEEVNETKTVIGIFMSPFDVHFNRAPLDGCIDFVRHYPGLGANVHMGRMHWRTFAGLEPFHVNSMHIVQNERTVTRFVGEYAGTDLSVYVVQIGARTVNGIDMYYKPGDRVSRGATFGMIRIGSQVDLILPTRAPFVVAVRPGDRVRAGETILVSWPPH